MSNNNRVLALKGPSSPLVQFGKYLLISESGSSASEHCWGIVLMVRKEFWALHHCLPSFIVQPFLVSPLQTTWVQVYQHLVLSRDEVWSVLWYPLWPHVFTWPKHCSNYCIFIQRYENQGITYVKIQTVYSEACLSYYLKHASAPD